MPIRTEIEAVDAEYRSPEPVTEKVRRRMLSRAVSLRGSVRAMHGQIVTAERREKYRRDARQ